MMNPELQRINAIVNGEFGNEYETALNKRLRYMIFVFNSPRGFKGFNEDSKELFLLLEKAIKTFKYRLEERKGIKL